MNMDEVSVLHKHRHLLTAEGAKVAMAACKRWSDTYSEMVTSPVMFSALQRERFEELACDLAGMAVDLKESYEAKLP